MGYSTPLSATLSSTSPAAQGYNTATFAKPDVTAAGSSGAWNSPSTITMFTVTGTVAVRPVGVVGATAITSTAGTGVISLGTTANTTALIGATTVSGGAQFGANTVWQGTTPTGLIIPWLSTGNWNLVNGANIVLSISTNSMTAGSMTVYLEWIPLSAGATVVAATP